MLFARTQIVTANSMASNITSSIVLLDQAFGYSVQCIYTTSGTLAGTLKLQGSNNHVQDINGNVITAGTFTDIPGQSTTLSVSANGSYMFNVEAWYLYFQLVYTTANSDTGVLNAFATIKGV